MTLASSAAESDLLARLQAGEEQAFAEWVTDQSPRLLTVARRFLRSEHDACDAVQDAFVAAFRKLASFEGNSSLSTWLHRIVVNCCLMKLRSQSRRRTTSIDELLPQFDDTGHHRERVRAWTHLHPDSLEREELRTQIRDSIDRLPDDYRTVLILRDIQEVDTHEAAEMLALTPGALKVRLHRARQALRGLLDAFMSAP
jgi:RNA polymerase sigma-70 factor (ECF subfamily)